MTCLRNRLSRLYPNIQQFNKIPAIVLCMRPDDRPASLMRAPLAACRELALDYNTLPKLLYVIEHKT